MLYFRISVIIISALGLLIYTLIFDRRYFLKLLTIEVILSGFLAFYIFYHIGNYSTAETDYEMSSAVNGGEDGIYTIDINVKWSVKPQIFGYNGDADSLILRYNPELLEIVSADTAYKESKRGKSLLKLSKDFEYSKLNDKEKEIGFAVADGADRNFRLKVKSLCPGCAVKVFFIHDHEIPMDLQTFYEKMLEINIE